MSSPAWVLLGQPLHLLASPKPKVPQTPRVATFPFCIDTRGTLSMQVVMGSSTLILFGRTYNQPPMSGIFTLHVSAPAFAASNSITTSWQPFHIACMSRNCLFTLFIATTDRPSSPRTDACAHARTHPTTTYCRAGPPQSTPPILRRPGIRSPAFERHRFESRTSNNPHRSR
jgi:hypothetical protein